MTNTKANASPLRSATSRSVAKRASLPLAVAVGIGLASGVASASQTVRPRSPSAAMLEGTPFDSGVNAAALPRLGQGQVVKRTSSDGTLTADDHSRLRALGLPNAHYSAVFLHEIKRTDGQRQLARLATLAHSVDQLAPSGACERIVATGDGVGMCSGHVDGPVGEVAVRMPVALKLTESDKVVRLVVSNPRALEVKPLFGWSEVVAPGRLKLVYDMFPTNDGWLVYARVGVEMSAHEGSSKKISESLVNLESWLTKELARS